MLLCLNILAQVTTTVCCDACSKELTAVSSLMVVNVCQALFQCSKYMCNFN